MQPQAFETEVASHYFRMAETPAPYPPLQGDIETEVCVVGGGLAGLNTALGLVQRGVPVALVEARHIAYGASGRNGGFVAKGFAAGEMSLLKKFGPERARDFVEMTKSARQLIQNRIADFGIDCGPLRDGVLTVSWRDNPKATQEYITAANASFDLGFEFWPREKVREHCRTALYYDGVYSPHDFQFNPLQYARGLARQAAALGALLYEATPALRVEKTGAGYLIHTPQGRITARQVVMCCATYIDGLDKRLANAFFPVKTFVMVTKPLSPEALAGSVNTPHAIYDNRFCSDYYRVLDDNRILWGGRVALTSPPPGDIAAMLLGDLLKIYPQLNGQVEADSAWSGDLCYAPHKMPQIGRLETGYWYNTCFGGHGLAPTTVGGELIAAAIASGDKKSAAGDKKYAEGLKKMTDSHTTSGVFADARAYEAFRPFAPRFAGGAAGRYVAQLVYHWWRLRDRLNI